MGEADSPPSTIGDFSQKKEIRVSGQRNRFTSKWMVVVVDIVNDAVVFAAVELVLVHSFVCGACGCLLRQWSWLWLSFGCVLLWLLLWMLLWFAVVFCRCCCSCCGAALL
eukprot:TRINITY_DN26588_c0_g1_i1.p1 TRINITY_DN26588_c0_g1~~TRINITY_DN26588_c0_g1_i1.p1  ORF type:complete len:110 (-),score=12.13 TRINITY_DN26588_c0_g1_i1:131-460(-)